MKARKPMRSLLEKAQLWTMVAWTREEVYRWGAVKDWRDVCKAPRPTSDAW